MTVGLIYFGGFFLTWPVFYYFIRRYITAEEYFDTDDVADTLLTEFMMILTTIMASMMWPLVVVAYAITKATRTVATPTTCTCGHERRKHYRSSQECLTRNETHFGWCLCSRYDRAEDTRETGEQDG